MPRELSAEEHAERVLRMEDRGRPAGDSEDATGAPDWPALDRRALYGPLGELVKVVEPHSEADPVALLVQALIGFGSIVGRGPHFRVEGDEHHGNLFAALVGDTAKGRKGSSWGQVRRVFRLLDLEWTDHRVVSGLSSGEGLIWQVRDPIYKMKDGEEELVDPGVEDKRLLAVEGELAQVLKVMTRQGNTLSPVVRSAWDGVRLQSITKNSPGVATGASIAIVGHITRSELLRHLGEDSAANGFGNRFLWLLVKRSKCLPWGGRLETEDLTPVVQKLGAAVGHARTLGAVEPDDEARVLWEAVYPKLSEGKPGLLGAMVARAEAQVMRIALLYALADQAVTIGREHLVAALALWDYAEASARYVFGDALGDPVADEILEALRRAGSQGMTRTEIRDLFKRHKGVSEIGRALGVLQDQGLAEYSRVETGGRPTERWVLSHRSHMSQGGP